MSDPKRGPAAWQGHGSGGGRRLGKQPVETIAQPELPWTRMKLAPFSKAILEQQRAGRTPNVYLFAGSDAWNQAEYRRRTHGDGSALVLPPGERPEAFRWPALDALVLVPGDEAGDIIRALIVRLLAAGTRCVVEIRPGLAPIAHYAEQSDVVKVTA